MRRVLRGVVLLFTGLSTLVLGPVMACAETAPVADAHAHHHGAPAEPAAPAHDAACDLAIGCLVAVTPLITALDAAPSAALFTTYAEPNAEWAGPSRAPEPPPPRG
jgi:hypothetical protein